MTPKEVFDRNYRFVRLKMSQYMNWGLNKGVHESLRHDWHTGSPVDQAITVYFNKFKGESYHKRDLSYELIASSFGKRTLDLTDFYFIIKYPQDTQRK